jgi:Na+/proline symporter/nitrogen-specific signal transduction histidine kinase
MKLSIIIIISVAYIALLFFLAYYAESREKKGRSIVNNPLVYALSLSIYCTAWTFYGSVGRAASTGIGFLPIYLGPAILAPVWWIVLKKMVLISKSLRITSIADFISSRYGKSATLGLIATLIAVLGVIPYISIQLKAIVNSFHLLRGVEVAPNTEIPFFQDSALFIAIALAVFTILFGTRHLDPNERHPGLVAAIAFESVLKLVAFISIGLFVCFGLYGGFENLFNQAAQSEKVAHLFQASFNTVNAWEWFWLIILSMSAVLFLPRQFHVAVVENTDINHIRRASWMFPLYLMVINIFVIPIALAGLLYFPGGQIEPDNYVLSLPLAYGKGFLALFVALGGFSAATSMVVVAVIALSIMIGNNLVLPFLLRSSNIQEDPVFDLNTRLLGIRRLSIVIVLLLAYAFFKAIGEKYSLVSVGLISFTAIAQFLPAILGGLFWKRGTKKGAIWSLIAGFIIWAYTLPIPTLVETNFIDSRFIEEGLFGIAVLKPYQLFGLESGSPIANAAFWSLLFNFGTYFFVSINTTPGALEITQADQFVDIYKYGTAGKSMEVVRRQAKVKDIVILLNRFLGPGRAKNLLAHYETLKQIDLSAITTADANLVNYTETHLAGAIGAASAKVIMQSIAKEDPISLEEMLKVLEQTQEVIQYSKALEKKSAELEITTRQLKAANEKLQELDHLKADFIATVTHELRTPITSIRALSKIMLDTPALPIEKREEFLEIVVVESERLSRLINQVLDLEKIQSLSDDNMPREALSLNQLLEATSNSLQQMMKDHKINYQLILPDQAVFVHGHPDRLQQAVINLLSNAIKFCQPGAGVVKLQLDKTKDMAEISVFDNGKGISAKDQDIIFQRFTQITDSQQGKPKGSGLGLFITQTIVEQHQGKLEVESQQGKFTIFKIRLPLYKAPA